MPIYWSNIDVRFREPLELESEEATGEKVYGYIQNIGATFSDEEALKFAISGLVSKEMDTDNLEIIYDYLGVISPNDIEKDIYGDEDIADSLQSDPLTEGIWYCTGRGFYTNNE